ncbi:hypothetical protein PI124_g24008 [Phytophthora idaei]|nr:hypothetical protein PI124_g24008 [Phytophthora idaei]
MARPQQLAKTNRTFKLCTAEDEHDGFDQVHPVEEVSAPPQVGPLYQLKDGDSDGGDLSAAKASFAMLQTKVVEAPILRHFDRSRGVHIMLFANAWALSATLLQEHESALHPVLFRGRVLPSWEPVSNLSCGGLLYDYLLERKRDRCLQIVQVADEV